MTHDHRPSDQRPATPTQRLHEVTMTALARRPSEPVSDVTISRNAKGDFQFEVTVRGTDIHRCQLAATALVSRLRRLYPHSSETAAPVADGEGVEL